METRTKVIDSGFLYPYTTLSGDHIYVNTYEYDKIEGRPVKENWRHHNNAVRIVKSTLGINDSANLILNGAKIARVLETDNPLVVDEKISSMANAISDWNFAVKDSIVNNNAMVIDPTTFQYDSALARSIPEMTPSLDTGFSLVNFILELKDLKFLYKNWFTRKGRLKRLSGLSKAIKPKASWGVQYQPVGSPLSELWRLVSDLHLEWAFGLKPFIQDVATIVDKLRHSQKRVSDFLEKSGQVQRHHYFEDVSLLQVDRSYSLPDFWGWPMRLSMFASTSVSEYRVSSKVTYKLLSSDIWFQTIQGWLDSFGVNSNPSIIWNAIPFSFVLDWFLNVGDLLDSMKVDNLKLECKIWDLCHSLRILSLGNVEINLDGDWIPLGYASISYYEREPTLFPNGKIRPRVSGFSPTEILLAQSLVATRRRARKRRVRLG